MFARVHHFLHGKGADFLCQFRRCALAECLHTFDEKGLTFRESGRQRVEKGGREGVAIVPPTTLYMAFATSETPVARRDDQIRRVGAAFCTAISVSILTGAFTSCPLLVGNRDIAGYLR